MPSSDRLIPSTANSLASPTKDSMNGSSSWMMSAPAFVHHLRVGHQQRALVAIELVLGEPHRRERTGHRDLDRFAGQGPQDFDIAHLHRVCAADFPDHARHDLARAVTPL